MSQGPYRQPAGEAWYPRPMPKWAKLLAPFLDRYRWFRRLVGGRWEQWWIETCYADIWFYVNEEHFWSRTVIGRRPPCAHGSPIIEEYPYRNEA